VMLAIMATFATSMRMQTTSLTSLSAQLVSIVPQPRLASPRLPVQLASTVVLADSPAVVRVHRAVLATIAR
jgi:hypothetical protein